MPCLKNAKHELFCQAIVEGKGIAESYRLAGFKAEDSYACGSRLSRKVNVVARIAEMQANQEAAIAAKVGISKAYIIEKLQVNLSRALQEVAVLDNEGQPTGEYRYEGNVANKSLELMGKELGMFSDKLKVSGDESKPLTVVVRHVGTDN